MRPSSPSPSLTLRSPNRFRSRSALTSVAAMGAIAAPSMAQAAIVYSGVLNTTTVSGNATTFTLDFNGAPIDGSELIISIGKASTGIALRNIQIKTSDFGDTAVHFTPLAVGTTVDSSLTFSTTGAYLRSPTQTTPSGTSTPYYYGFSYTPTSVEGTLYGWFQYTTTESALTSVTLNGWAYNSIAGEAITVGQTAAVPEPAAFGALLGVAALGVVWFRRRPHCKTSLTF